MNIGVGEKWLITTDDWFFAPDGECYRAVHGTVKSINNDESTLGVKTNRGRTNWYVYIGNMIVAGCQNHYAVKTEKVNYDPAIKEIEHDGELLISRQPMTRIYNADE